MLYTESNDILREIYQRLRRHKTSMLTLIFLNGYWQDTLDKGRGRGPAYINIHNKHIGQRAKRMLRPIGTLFIKDNVLRLAIDRTVRCARDYSQDKIQADNWTVTTIQLAEPDAFPKLASLLLEYDQFVKQLSTPMLPYG